MKLVDSNEQGYKFIISLGERRLLQNLIKSLQNLPLICPDISRKDPDKGKKEERQEMLVAVLKEHRANTVKQASLLLEDSKFTKTNQLLALYWIISKSELETILVALNDLRVSCWYAMGQPLPSEIKEETMLSTTMDAAGFFEEHLLDLIEID